MYLGIIYNIQDCYIYVHIGISWLCRSNDADRRENISTSKASSSSVSSDIPSLVSYSTDNVHPFQENPDTTSAQSAFQSLQCRDEQYPGT